MCPSDIPSNIPLNFPSNILSYTHAFIGPGCGSQPSFDDHKPVRTSQLQVPAFIHASVNELTPFWAGCDVATMQYGHHAAWPPCIRATMNMAAQFRVAWLGPQFAILHKPRLLFSVMKIRGHDPPSAIFAKHSKPRSLFPKKKRFVAHAWGQLSSSHPPPPSRSKFDTPFIFSRAS